MFRILKGSIGGMLLSEKQWRMHLFNLSSRWGSSERLARSQVFDGVVWLCGQGLESYSEHEVEPFFDRNKRKEIKRWWGWMVSLYPLELSLSIWQIISSHFPKLSSRLRKTTEINWRYCICHTMSLFIPQVASYNLSKVILLWTNWLNCIYISYFMDTYSHFWVYYMFKYMHT